jgi:hypothetical protein
MSPSSPKHKPATPQPPKPIPIPEGDDGEGGRGVMRDY